MSFVKTVGLEMEMKDEEKYPAGFLYPYHVVTKNILPKNITFANYQKFGSNIQNIKDGEIKNISGRNLILFDGKNVISFDVNDSVEIIASKKSGALLTQFDNISKKYSESITALKDKNN